MTSHAVGSRVPTAGALAHQADASERGLVVRLTLLWTLVVMTVLAWRNDVYYSGGVDKVVLAKSGISLVAFAWAFLMWQRTGRALEVGVRTLVIVSVYLTATVIGGWAAGSFLAATVVAVRVALLGATLVLVVLSVPAWTLLRTMGYALTALALLCSVTTLPAAAGGARLSGGLFPVNSNQLAMMFGVPLILLAWRAMAGVLNPFRVAAIVGLIGLIWLTGSRTGLAAAMLAVAIVILLSERVPIASFLGVVLAIPAVFYVAAATGLVSHYVDRGGANGNVANFNSRTIAWHAAFSAPHDFWGLLFGRGLSAKTVSVSGTYWNTQVLDSSWVSAFVQGGWIGLLCVAVWALLTIWGAARIPRPGRAMWVALCVFALLWSITASGLLDAYVLFILMATTSLAGERPMRSWASGAG